ncbi:MAG: PD-(D/E)XK nuclease family protein [Oscillatoriales cyanobacterium RM1_1_9]|nr:PD-(D/E)XK nuclease family protein [Oscillatoriales cyanobacterium RM1_1_9]
MQLEPPLPRYCTRAVWEQGKQYYRLPTGASYPGVTTILSATEPPEQKQALWKWRKRVGQEAAQQITSQSSRWGIKLHKYIEAKLQGHEPEDLPPELTGFWNSIHPFLDQAVERSLLIEGTVWNSKYRYAGKLDCLAIVEGQPTICDWKTAQKPRQSAWNKTHYLQCAAYATAVEQVYIKFGIAVKQSLGRCRIA